MHTPPSRHTQGELAACLEGRCQCSAACFGTSHHHQAAVSASLLGRCLTVSLPLMQWADRFHVVLQEERRTARPQHPQESSPCPSQGQLPPSQVTTCHLSAATQMRCISKSVL